MSIDEQNKILSETFAFLNKQDVEELLTIAQYKCYQNKETIVKSGENIMVYNGVT